MHNCSAPVQSSCTHPNLIPSTKLPHNGICLSLRRRWPDFACSGANMRLINSDDNLRWGLKLIITGCALTWIKSVFSPCPPRSFHGQKDQVSDLGPSSYVNIAFPLKTRENYDPVRIKNSTGWKCYTNNIHV